MGTYPTFDKNSVARGTFVDQKATKFTNTVSDVPRKVLLIGNASTSISITSKPVRLLTASDANDYGAGSELASMIEAAFSYNPNIDLYALAVKPTNVTSVSKSTITTTGTATSSGMLYFYINGIQVSVGVAINDNAENIATNIIAAISSNIKLPVIAEIDSVDSSIVNLSSKWEGITANDISLIMNYYEVDKKSSPIGITIAMTKFEGGLGLVDLKATFSNWGNTWFTLICMPFVDSVNLKDINDLANTSISADEVRAFQIMIASNASRDDYIEFIKPLNYNHTIVMHAENSITPPNIIAASAAVSIENMHAEAPMASYYGKLNNVMAGTNVEMITYKVKDAIVKYGGCTTISNDDNTVSFENTVTTYKENEAGTPSNDWRYPQVMAGYQLLSHQTKTMFSSSPYTRAILVDEDSNVDNPLAVKPSKVKSSIIGLVRNLSSSGVIKYLDNTLSNIDVGISKENGTRIEGAIPIFWALPLEQKVFLYNWSTETL